jgi:parallel beta-helix repeat protein
MARTESTWLEYDGSYVAVPWQEGRDVLIRGTSKYINFGSISGSSGYGFRDNAGTMQVKNSGGSWTNFGSGAGGGHTIQDEGTPLTQRTNLNFVGTGVTVTDDAGNDATVVTITSGGGSGDVVGPASATDNAIARYDGTTGKLIQNSSASIADDGTVSATSFSGGASALTALNINGTAGNGHIHLKHQSIDPSSQASSTTIFADTNGNPAWINDGLSKITIDGDGVSAARTYTLPDASGTVALTSDLHSAVTVTDSTSIDFTLTGQDITAQREALTGAITASKNSNTTSLGSFTKAQLDTAVSDGNVLYVGDITQYTDELAQDAVGAMVDTTLVYTDATPLLSRAALTGAVTASAGSNTTSLGSFTKSQLSTAVSDGDVLFVGDVTTNATHTGEVTGATALTVDKTAISNRTDTVITASDYILFGDASDTDNLKKDTVQGILDLVSSGSNTYFNDIFIDQSGGTSDTYGALSGTINGSNALFTVSQSAYATGTLQVWLNGQLLTQGSSEDWVETTPASGTFTFNTAPPTGSLITVAYQKVVTNSSTVITTSNVNEYAQDAVGTILTDSSEIDFTYNDGVPTITASIVAGSIDETKLDTSVNASLDLADTASQPGHTHTAANITDFDTEVSNNTDVAANTAARHAAVTVTDSSEINFTLTGQDITANIIAGSIDETKLDASTNASLDLADSALQASAISDTIFGTGWNTDTTHAPSKNAVYDIIATTSFNVKTYGALGDGSTNDYTAIAAAITAASVSGGVVYFPAGNYKIGTGLTISSSNVTLMGSGFGSTTITLNNSVNSSAVTISGTGTVGVTICDLTIDGNKANNTSGHGIRIDTPYSSTDTQHLLRNIDVVNAKQDGISIVNDTRVVRMFMVRSRYAGDNGYSIAGSDHQVFNAIADASNKSGFVIYCTNGLFFGCKAFYCDAAVSGYSGFRVEGTRNFFTSCEAQDNEESGWRLIGADNSTLSNCIADSNGKNYSLAGSGLSIEDTDNTSVTGGAFFDRGANTFPQSYGIVISGTSTGNSVVGETYYGNVTGTFSDTSSGTNRLTVKTDVVVPDEAYGSSWNGSLEVPTKNAVYDKIETLGGAGDIALTLKAPSNDQTITAGYSAYVSDLYEVASTFSLEVGLASVFEIG